MTGELSTLSQVLRQRNRRAGTKQPVALARSGVMLAVLLSLLIALAGLSLAIAGLDLLRNLPDIQALPALLEPPDGLLLEPTRLYDRSGKHLILSLENPDAAGHEYLYSSAPGQELPGSPQGVPLPSNLVTATLATADPGFWSHPGFALAAPWTPARGWGFPTTLAQRLADEYLLSGEPAGLRRELRQRLLAAQLTQRYGREKILEWYLNSTDYGRLAYGADAAARVYLGKPAGQLSLAEAALLAATAEDPALNPLDAPTAALERQKHVIQEMLRYRMISPDAGIQAAREIINLRRASDPAGESQIAPAFTRLALQQLGAQLPLSQIERGGLQVITTLDFDLQTQANCLVAARLGRAFDAASCPAARMLPPRPEGETAIGNQAEAVVLDPATGQVLALVGESTQVDLSGRPQGASLPAPLPVHDPGTLLTPFIYLTGFTRGLGPASLVWDIPDGQGQGASANLDGRFYGPLRLRQALANDAVNPAESVLEQVGAENVWRTTQQFGLAFPRPNGEPQTNTEAGKDVPPLNGAVYNGTDLWSLFRDVNLLEASHAFSALANRGILAGLAWQSSEVDRSLGGRPPRPAPLQPSAVLSVKDTHGNLLLDWSAAQTRPIISSQLAYLLTDVLSDEPARWPSWGYPNALEIGRPAAAKPGWTRSGEDSWVLGYTPQRVIGVWLGSQAQQQSESVRQLQNSAAGLWHALARYASRDLPAEVWVVPDDISHVQVCDPSGLLPTEVCPNTVKEIFLAGNEPDQTDTLYRSLPVNRQTGRLATLFTPPDLVEWRPYFIPPAEASGWAAQTGLAAPPGDYDAIPPDLATWPEAQITSPSMFAVLRGVVPVLGTAAGENFAFYGLQYGSGLNPGAWFQIGSESTTPVTDGILGEWDTQALDGLYALQLLVVDDEKNVRRTTVMVSLDNQPPQVEILVPRNGEAIQPEPGGQLVLQANISDNLGLKEVVFRMDGQALATLVQPPYAISWAASPGSHSLVVEATDLAGNVSQSTATFTVAASPR